MASCHICLDDLKKPVALPCGHIFCGECIVKTVQSVQPYSHLHACPLCRTLYNIAPINMQVVPPNLRPFVTPSVRRVYLNTPDNPPSPSTADTAANTAPCTGSNTSPSPPSPSSSMSNTLSRLEAENVALRTSCAMWRRRAELHGSANLGLLNFAKMVRDQASILVREREELRGYCQSLKHKLDTYESSQNSVDQLLQAFQDASERMALEPESQLHQQQQLEGRCMKPLPSRARSGPRMFHTPSTNPSPHPHTAPLPPASSSSSSMSHPHHAHVLFDERYRKRIKLDRDQLHPSSGGSSSSASSSSMDGLLGTAGRAIFLPQPTAATTGQAFIRPPQTEAPS